MMKLTAQKVVLGFTEWHVLHAARSSHEKAVCPSVHPSVRLSNAWIVTKQKKILPGFYTT